MGERQPEPRPQPGRRTASNSADSAKTGVKQKYVICNADEGDPGALMDRSVLESDPHRVLEGMLIAAYAIGASEGYIYVRAEYPLAVQRLTVALQQARRRGFLGNGICETTVSFDIDIRLGAGAFVCGEETALIASIEGKRGTPRPGPPYRGPSRRSSTPSRSSWPAGRSCGRLPPSGRWAD